MSSYKKPGVEIGLKEKAQPWQYVRELIERGLVTASAKVSCFVLGSKVDPSEAGEDTKWDGRVLIRPISYDVFIRRAEARMLGLREKLTDAPFLREYLGEPKPIQSNLELKPLATSA